MNEPAATAPVEITLILDGRDLPPRGQITRPDARELSFAGWAGLASALTTLLADASAVPR